MNRLKIQQGSNVEIVTTLIIKKLYEAALSVPEPLEGELDAAYMSGNLLVNKSYRVLVEYLTNRFDDLHINVTDSYYIPFEDSAVLSALIASNISSDGVGITEDDVLAVTSMSLLGLAGNTSISSFVELKEFKNIVSSSNRDFAGCTNLEWIALPDNNRNLSTSFQIKGGKTLKWVVPSVAFACSRTFESWYNNPGRGGGGDHTWTLYDLNKQPITDVVIPEGTTTIGKYVFSKMSCNSISIPSSITFISLAAFENTHTIQPSGAITLPNLTSLGSGAFSGCSGITSVDLTGSTITSIPNSCFLNCTSLTSFTGFSNITSIEPGAFNNTKITGDLSIPNLTGTLGNNAFRNTNITSISDLGSITAISPGARYGYGEGAFGGCKTLTTVTLPSTLTSISGGFDTCTSLMTVNGNLLNLTSLTNSAFLSTKISSIPNMAGLLTIGISVFGNCSLLSVAVNCPNLISLGDKAFWSSGITSITNLGSITSIPNECFRGCTSLTSVTLPTTCTSIGNNSFNGCNITGPIDLSNVTSIGENAFYGCNLGAVVLPNISSLTHRSFDGCGVTSFDISESSITNIALLNLVTGDQLTSVKLPTTVTTFGSTYGQTFYSKNITELRGVLGITTVYASNYNNILNPLPLLSLLTSNLFIIKQGMSDGLVITASCPQVYLPVFKYCTRTTIAKAPYSGNNNPEKTFFQNYTNLKMPIRLLYFKDLEYIRPFMFYGASVISLVINNTTCPTFNTSGMTYTNLLDTAMSDFTDWSTKPFGNMPTATMTIYVPNSAVSAYQADSNYNSYTILGIGLLNSGVIYATEDDWVAANKPDGLIAEYLGLNTADLATFVSANNLTYWTNSNA